MQVLNFRWCSPVQSIRLAHQSQGQGQDDSKGLSGDWPLKQLKNFAKIDLFLERAYLSMAIIATSAQGNMFHIYSNPSHPVASSQRRIHDINGFSFKVLTYPTRLTWLI